MKRTTVKEIFSSPEEFSGKTLTVAGWARTIRASNAFGFIELNDGSTFSRLQIVIEADKISNYAEIAKQNVGAALIVKGTLVLTPDAPQPFEIKAEEVTVEGASTPDYPLQKKKTSLEFLRTIPHLRPRANIYTAVFRVRSEAAFAIHKFFNERGFLYAHTPLITVSDCEGAGEMFRVTNLDMDNPPKTEDGKVDFSKDFFGKAASLTVSGQLNAECFAQAFANVYTFGPTFRAERSYTPRHAAEFWMIEPEIAFSDLEDDMELAEAMTKSVISHVLKTCSAELAFFNKFVDNTVLERLNNIVSNDFARVSYTDAVKLLEESGEKFEFKPFWGCDLQTEHERYLCEKVFKKPVFVINYPREIKAFYMRRNDDGKTVAAMDMLVPGVGELIGGSQREERLDLLEKAYKDFGLNPEDYCWYTELRKYGGTHHAGFGLGFERLIMYITGVSNIRDVELFPRTTGNADI